MRNTALHRIFLRSLPVLMLAIRIIACSSHPTALPSLIPSQSPVTPAQAVQEPPAALISPTFTFQPTLTITAKPATFLTSTPTLSPILAGRILTVGMDGIYIMDTEGKTITKISGKEGEFAYYFTPAWSPDGHWVAFMGTKLGVEGGAITAYDDIYLAKADGSLIKQLTHSPKMRKRELTWSIDGDKILFAGDDAVPQSDLYLVSISDGDHYVNITNTEESEASPAWSPDGKYIAYLLAQLPDQAEKRLYVMDVDGKNRREIAKVDAWFERIAWSPDGKKIAFGAEEGCGNIYTVNMDGSDLKLLTNHPDQKGSVAWSPDGRHLLFEGSDTSCPGKYGFNGNTATFSLFYMNQDGTGITALFPNIYRSQKDPDWAKVPALVVGKEYIVTELGDKINLREKPSLKGKIIGKLHTGETISILIGPHDEEDYYWWQVRTADGIEGWAVEKAFWYRQK